MGKQITITIPTYIYENYLSNLDCNRSEYICSLIVAGTEATINKNKSDNTLLVQLTQENANLQAEIRQLKLTVGNYKLRMNKRDMKLIKRWGGTIEEAQAKQDNEDKIIRMAQAMRNAGALERMGGG